MRRWPVIGLIVLVMAVASGGVVFTTIQKFLPAQGEKMPELSPRRNIIVIADEAHRSQYDLIDGLARHMRDALPNASFIGFTGTPIEKTDANTQAVFGDYISIYDIQRAVADKATVPIYYESRGAWDTARQTERSAGCRSREAATASTSKPSGPRWRHWWAIRSASRSLPLIWWRS